jgi:hypothetical protein
VQIRGVTSLRAWITVPQPISTCLIRSSPAISSKRQRRRHSRDQERSSWRKQLCCKYMVYIIVFLNSPCYETPKNAIKKSSKTTEGGRGGGGGTEGQKKPRFCDEPRFCFFSKKKSLVFLNSTCYETPRNSIKELDRKKKRKHVTAFFWGCGRSTAPLGDQLNALVTDTGACAPVRASASRIAIWPYIFMHMRIQTPFCGLVPLLYFTRTVHIGSLHCHWNIEALCRAPNHRHRCNHKPRP